MADFKDNPKTGRIENVLHHDEGDGTFSQANAAHMRGWDTTDQAWYRLPVDHATGYLLVKTSGGASGGTSAIDDAAFTVASDSGTPMMGVVTADSVDSGDVGVIGMLANRQIKATLYDSTGVELAVGGGTQYSEDTVSGAADKVTMAGVVRKDTAATLVDTDGDRTQMQVDANGRLHVNASGVAVPVTDNGGSLTVDNGGTFAVQADTELTTADLDTGAGTDTRAVVGIVGAASGGAVLVQATSGGALKGDLTTIAGTATSVNSGTKDAGTQRVILASDQTVVPVSDNSGSLTVDAPVGTPVFVRLSDGSSAIATLPVSLASLPALATGTNTIGDVNLTAAARGGWSPFLVDALTATVTVSAAAGKFAGVAVLNTNSAPAYIQVFDTTGAVTLGTTVPTFVIPIPANATAANGAGIVMLGDVGVAITNGIKIAATTTPKGSATVSTGLNGTALYK